MFKKANFKSHSGKELDWKIICDNLTDEDLECLAYLISGKVEFSEVVPVPDGGVKLAEKLAKYGNNNSKTILIVDDVLTTGKSMEEARFFCFDYIEWGFDEIVGMVIFARGKLPNWVFAIFELGDLWKEKA